MFRKHDQHRQSPLFSTLDDLPDKQRQRLEKSWAATFYEDFFCRIDEDIFSILYSDQASRPNIAVNVLVSLETLKAGFGWSDAELEEQMAFNIQTRYALGYRDLTVGHFELRTVYNFRRRLAQHMQETGENLLEEAFEQITDEQIESLQVKTGKLRMDSTQVASNIRQTSRLQLLVEVVQRVWRRLSAGDREGYETEFAPYLKGKAGHYVYHIKSGEAASHLEALGQFMRWLVAELGNQYGEEAPYQVLKRVYEEHFVEVASGLRPKVGDELSAQSLQSPDDLEASYREKKGKGYRGYVTNVTETCDPENELQLIVKVQTAPNSVDDAALLVEAVPQLVERMTVEEMNTDGAYNSAEADKTLAEAHIEQFQTAIRGQKSDPECLGVTDFVFTRDEEGQPQAVRCPQGQQVEVKQGRKAHRFSALFDPLICQTCPLLVKCPTQELRRNPQRVLRFSQQQVHVAHRRENQRSAQARDKNQRSAVEATMRSVKHPFRQGKVPVRGHPRVSMLMLSSAAMTNVRRIWRYRTEKKTAKNTPMEDQKALKQAFSLRWRSFLLSLIPLFGAQPTYSLAAA